MTVFKDSEYKTEDNNINLNCVVRGKPSLIRIFLCINGSKYVQYHQESTSSNLGSFLKRTLLPP